MSLALRNLFQNKTRLFLSIAGVALAVMLILLLNGFLAGMNYQLTSYLSSSPGSIVVAEKGVRNLLGATSLLPRDAVSETEKIEGVDKAVPILSQFVIIDFHAKKQPAYLIGYLPEQGGGPWELASGREPQTDHELVLDQVLARRHDKQIGDKMQVMGQEFEIVGLSAGTSSWMTSFLFIRKSALEQLLRAPGATSYLLVSLKTGASEELVRQQLDSLDGVNSLKKPEMAANDLNLFAKVFSAPLKLMAVIAFLVGSLVIGLVIYTATVERQREYGVLKAIGAANKVIYKVVTLQALAAAVIGASIGILLAFAVSEWIMAAWPQFLVLLAPGDMGIAILAGLGMALTIYTAVLSRRAEYGVLKALGAKNSFLYRSVLAQALMSVILGFSFGLLLTWMLSLAIPWIGLNLTLVVDGASILKVGAASGIIASLSSLLPIRQIAGLDPAMVFRGK